MTEFDTMDEMDKIASGSLQGSSANASDTANASQANANERNANASDNSNAVATIARAIRNSLIANYDYDLSQRRCPKTGRLLGALSDSELYHLFQISQMDLVKTSERLETLFIHNSHCLADWVYTDTEALDYHRVNTPRDYMMFAIKSLIETSVDYLPYKNKTNYQLTEEGKVLFYTDFFRFAEGMEKITLATDEIERINDKLTLLLSLVGLATVERLKNHSLSSFDKILSLAESHTLGDSLEDIVTFLVDQFKLRYAISREQDLSLKDIELIRQAHRKRERDEYAEKANAVKIFRDIKRYHDSMNFLNNIVGELFINQHNSFSRELKARESMSLADKINKGIVSVNQNGKLVESETPQGQFSQLTKINLTRKIVIK